MLNKIEIMNGPLQISNIFGLCLKYGNVDVEDEYICGTWLFRIQGGNNPDLHWELPSEFGLFHNTSPICPQDLPHFELGCSLQYSLQFSIVFWIFFSICICCVLAHLTLQHRGAVLKLWPTHFLSLSDKVGCSKPLLRWGDHRNCANQTYSIQR